MLSEKLNNKEVSFLMRLYNEQPLGMDSLPYTKVFEQLVKDFHAAFGNQFDHHVLWKTLVNLRKQKKLMRKSRSKKIARI
jgi:hypothetical protein